MNEAVLELKLILGGCTNREAPYYKVITEAIRCMELLPELVEALNLTNKMMFGLDSQNSYADVFNYNIELLKKAKEVYNDK